MASTKDSLNDATRKLKSSDLASESSLNLAKHQIIRTSSQSVGNAIKAIGDIANMTAFTNGTVIFSGSNITINTSVSGTRQYLIISADNTLEGLNSVYAGDNISLSINGVSTTVSVTGLENYAYSWHSHDGLYFDISNSSLLQAISDNSLSLAASQSVNFINTSLSSKFLTTAAASNHIHGIASGTNITIGSSSNGLALSVGNYLTTAALSNHSHTYNMLAVENNGGTSLSTVGTASNTNGNVFFYPYGGLSVGLRNNNDIDIGLPVGVIPNISISGNTNGTPSVLSSGTAVFAGGNNITLSQNGNTISVIGAAAGTGGAGTGFTSSSTTGVDIAGTLDSAGLSLKMPAYITTAMQSNAGSNFVGLNSAITNGSMTVNSNGISIDLPSVSATASNSVVAGDYISLSTNGVNTTVSVIGLQATSGMSLYQAVSNSSLSLGTGAANSFINTAFSSLFQLTSDNSLSLAMSNSSLLQAVSNSSLSLGTGYTTHTHSQYINTSNSTYFANSTHTHSQYAGASHTHGAVALTGGIGATSASNGLSLSIPSYALSTHTHSQYINTSQTGSMYFSNTNGVTWSSTVSSNSTTMYVASLAGGGAGNYAGTSLSTISTTGSVLQGSVNTNGISLSVPAWITTAANAGVVVADASSRSITSGTLNLVNANGIIFGITSNSLSASYTVPSAGYMSFIDSNGVSFNTSTSGSSTTIYGSVNTNYIQSGSNAGDAWAPGKVFLNASSGTMNFRNIVGGDYIDVSTYTSDNNLYVDVKYDSLASNITGLIVGNFVATDQTSWQSMKGKYYNSTSGTYSGTGNYLLVRNWSTTYAGSTVNDSIGAVFFENGDSLGGLEMYLTHDLAARVHTHGSNVSLSLQNISGSVSSASNGLTISLTGNTGGGAGDGYNILAAGTQTAHTTGSVVFSNSNSVSFGMNNSSVITASFSQSTHDHPYVNTSQSSLFQQTSATSAITSAALPSANSTNFVQASQSGSVYFSNTNGVTWSSSVNSNSTTMYVGSLSATGAAAENNNINLAGNTSNNTTASGSTIQWIGGNNITLGATNGSQIRIDAARGSVIFANSNNLTFGSSVDGISTTITASYSMPTISTYFPWVPGATATQTLGAMGQTTGSLFLYPFPVTSPIAFNEMRLLEYASFATSTVSGAESITQMIGLFYKTSDSLTLISSTSLSFGVTNSSVSATINCPVGTATTGYSYNTVTASTTAQIHSLFGTAGSRLIGIQFGNSMSLNTGVYWLGVLEKRSTSNAAVGMSLGLVGNNWAPVQNVGPIGSATSALTADTAFNLLGMGVYTSTASTNYGGSAIPPYVLTTGMNNSATIMPMMTFYYTT